MKKLKDISITTKGSLRASLFLIILSMYSNQAFGQLDRNWILFNAGLKLDWVAGNPAIDSIYQNSYYDLIVDHISLGSSQISNNYGQLLFYSGASTVWNRNFHVMTNAPDTSSFNTGMYMKCINTIVLPIYNDTNIYYTYYSNMGDVFQNKMGEILRYRVQPWLNGNGEVTASDTIYKGTDATINFQVIKHGNGRDWWLLYWRSQSDSIMSFTQNADGSLSGPYFQYIDVFPDLVYANDHLFLSFTKDGDKLAIVNVAGPIHLYDFDRCTGQLNNKVVLDSCLLCANSTPYWNGLFSPDGSKFYLTRSDTLIQYDLSNLPISFDKHIIWYCSDGYDSGGSDLIRSLQLAPNGTIMVGTYVPDDTLHSDSGSHYLGVIRSPNSTGSACNFDRYGLFLNGYQSDGILPNIPNYDLGPLLNSPCDTLITTGLYEQSTKSQISFFPNPAQTEATLTWSGMQEGTFVLRDMLGRTMLQQSLSTNSGSIKLNLSDFPKGIYLWQVQNKVHAQNGKLVVE